MVLTVTLNPLLENKLFFKEVILGNNRAYKHKLAAGGKGINISRQLNILGIKNHALTFLGGYNGKKLRAVLEKENISFSVVSTKSETREATLVFDESKETLSTFFSTNSIITSNEIEQFIAKLDKAIINSSIVVFAGSMPNEECAKIIKEGIKLCNKYDKISILDSYGENYSELLDEQPTVLHNNISELQKSLNLELETEKEKLELLNYLYRKNIKLSFLTDGAEPIYAAKSDFHYKITNPKIQEKDSTGSGDAFVSAIIYGLEKALVFNDFVKLASAFGAVNASSWNVCEVKMDEAEKLLDKIEINEVGKKMKIINDDPTI